MNLLVRRVERSGCRFLRRRTYSTTTQSTSNLILQNNNILHQQCRNFHATALASSSDGFTYAYRSDKSTLTLSNEDVEYIIGKLKERHTLREEKSYYDADTIHDNLSERFGYVGINDKNKTWFVKKPFDTPKPTKAEEVVADVQEEECSPERALSALELANLEEITPGHVLAFLQKHAAKGSGKLIRQSDFITLCESSRPGKMKDAKVIATALKEFKCNNRFVLRLEGSRAAVDGMLRSMTPTWRAQDGRPKVRAASFVLEQILDGENTGLYYTIEVDLVNRVFKLLRKGLRGMRNNDFKVRLDNMGDETEEDVPKEELSDDEKLAKDALRLTEGVMKLLIKRRMRPEWDMKKRAKSMYLRRLQIGGGPHQETLQLATEISIMVGGSDYAQEKIIAPFDEAKKVASVDEITLKYIEEAKASEAAALSATAEDAEDAEVDVEGDGDGSEDAGDGDDQEGDAEEEPTATDVESEEEKKD